MTIPADHPKIKPAKIGVILANLGTPDATDYWSMRKYLSRFLSCIIELSSYLAIIISCYFFGPILKVLALSKVWVLSVKLP